MTEGATEMLDAAALDREAQPLAPAERRRPGRADIAPGLIPLLRRSGGTIRSIDGDFVGKWAPREPIAPPRGIALALVLCTPIWIGLGGLLYAFIW